MFRICHHGSGLRMDPCGKAIKERIRQCSSALNQVCIGMRKILVLLHNIRRQRRCLQSRTVSGIRLSALYAFII